MVDDRQLERVSRRATGLRARLATVARAIATTEDNAARTFEVLAEASPGRAQGLRSQAQRAREVAAKERDEAERYEAQT